MRFSRNKKGFGRLPVAAACSLVAALWGVEITAGESAIRIDEQSGANPWSNLEFPDADVDFQFAIISDNTGGAYPGVFDGAMTKLNLLQPEFVMSVGDLIEGYTNNRESMIAEWEEIDASVDKLEMPFFYVVGNHDMGDPASLEVWRERLGSTYYHFVYKDVLFLAMNTEDPPQSVDGWLVDGLTRIAKLEKSDPKQAQAVRAQLLEKVKLVFETGEEYKAAFSEEQVDYFKNVIDTYPDVKWTFVFVHRPVWQANPSSAEFQEIEAALKGRPYTVFAGHAHTYDYQQRNGMDYIRLSTTGGAWVLDPPGNFDQVAWITMTDQGPVVANVVLDGVFDKSGERKPLREKLQ